MSARRLCVVAALALAAGVPTESGRAQEPLAPLDGEPPVAYFIGEGDAGSGYVPGDRELCGWALDAWAAAADGQLRFQAADEDRALVRIYFVPAQYGQYGEMRAIDVGGRRGAAVYVRPDTDALGPVIGRAAREDPLMRDTIVYLTCLHELGHALGLMHTSRFEDVMYFFGFGGDIARFFGRYRDELESRDDIAIASGLSAGDRERLRALYSPL